MDFGIENEIHTDVLVTSNNDKSRIVNSYLGKNSVSHISRIINIK